MDRIQLTPEQIEVYAAAEDLIEVCDPAGKVVGRLLSAQLQETVADIKRRRQIPGPMYSSSQIREMLQRLEEVWKTEGPFPVERGREIIAELRKKSSRVMKYEIRWTSQADDELLQWWIAATDRKAINRAEEMSERFLSDDPFKHGVELLEGLYILDIQPLRFYFEVDTIKGEVVVKSVARFR